MPSLRRIRRSGSNPTITQPVWPSWPWSSPSTTGATVNDVSALSLTTFYRGVTLIASTIAGLPLHVYQESDDKPVPVKTRETAYLRRRPNEEMSRVTFWERVVADEVRGNAFIWVEKNDLGLPVHIYWVARQRMRVGRNTDGQKIYELDGELPMIDYKQGGEIVHIPNWGDSLVGYDIVKLAAQAIALGLTAEEYAAQTFGNGGVPPGVLTSEQELSDEDAEKLSDRWHRQRGGARNAAKTAVLGKGAKFQQTSADPEKLQMENLRKFQAGEIATLLGIPPHMLGLVDRSTSWGSGIAEQGRGFVTYTLNAHTTRLRLAVDDDLLVRELTDRYMEFDPGGLLRGGLLQQYQAHVLGWGRFLTTNEIRKDLNLEPVEGGDVLLQPMNMTQLAQPSAQEPGKEPVDADTNR